VVVAVPTWDDVLPTVILEAMAAARPVVGFAVEGIPEVVVHGETGLLSPAGAVDDLARDLVRVLSDPELAARLGAAGRRRFLERYVPEQMMQAHVELYEELLARRRSRISRRRRRRGRAG
jgi:glycosyltransferase involved in cell wall biosynthesis